jgi:DNA-binding CsgD family transcriptional regulator
MPNPVHDGPSQPLLHLAQNPGRLAILAMHWTEALHGSDGMHAALHAFSDLAAARVVHVYRLGADTGRRQTIATLDLDQARRPLVREIGPSLLPDDPQQMRPGTLWTLSELDPARLDAVEPRGRLWMKDRGVRDAGLIPLGRADGTLDLLEFYTVAAIDSRRRVECEFLAALSAEAWSRRPKGRIAALLAKVNSIGQRVHPHRAGDPLSPDNPWGLTPAELRLCALIRGGVDPADLGAHTGKSIATIRSHLNSIYSKADVTGQVGLVRVLVADTPPLAANGLSGEPGALRFDRAMR